MNGSANSMDGFDYVAYKERPRRCWVTGKTSSLNRAVRTTVRLLLLL